MEEKKKEKRNCKAHFLTQKFDYWSESITKCIRMAKTVYAICDLEKKNPDCFNLYMLYSLPWWLSVMIPRYGLNGVMHSIA